MTATPEKGDTFLCEMCGGEFEANWSKDEATEELHQDFGQMPTEDCVVICDDCYQIARPDNNPVRYEAWKRENDIPL